MPVSLADSEVSFQQGQLHALYNAIVSSPVMFPKELQQCFALRCLDRAWLQYREDRSISLGEQLCGAEVASERNAFLSLAVAALPSPSGPIYDAITLVRRISIRPLAAEAKQSDAIVRDGLDDLQRERDTVARPGIPTDPHFRLSTMIGFLRYSRTETDDAITATAATPCWAMNLLACADSSSFSLLKPPLPSPEAPLPFPGLVDRRAFRADRSLDERFSATKKTLLKSLEGTVKEIQAILTARQMFQAKSSGLQANSRAYQAWLLVYALRALTPAQLARALPATKAGAGKVLRQLETLGLVRNEGYNLPYRSKVRHP